MMSKNIDVTGVPITRLAHVAVDITLRNDMGKTLEDYGIKEDQAKVLFHDPVGAGRSFSLYIDYVNHIGGEQVGSLPVKVKVFKEGGRFVMATRDGLWQDHTPAQQAELLERLGIPERNPLRKDG